MTQTTQANTVVYFPHFADGQGFTTTIFLTALRPNQTTVQVEFFGQDGNPVSVQTGQGTNSSQNFSVFDNGETSIKTSGNASPMQMGWVRVTSNQPVGAMELLQLSSGGSMLSQVVIPSSTPINGTTTVVLMNGASRMAGVAIANVGSTTANVTTTIFSQFSSNAGSSTQQIPAMKQTAILVPSYNVNEGSMIISSSGGSVVIMALLLDGTEMSVLPILPARSSTTGGGGNPITSTVTVPGNTDLALAGQASGYKFGTSTAMGNSPVEAGLTLTPGQQVEFNSVFGSVNSQQPTGSTTQNTSLICFTFQGVLNNGISDIIAPQNSLVGVFLGPSAPTIPAPSVLHYETQASRDVVELRPALQQPFFIGNGRTSNGTLREVIVPAGATKLYLASLTCAGNVTNQTGSYSVTVQTH